MQNNAEIFNENKILKKIFNSCSYDIFQFLENSDIISLSFSNKFFKEVCDCHNLFTHSIKSLDKLYLDSLEKPINFLNKEKPSKVKEKFNFNISMNSFFESTGEFSQRAPSGKNRNKFTIRK